MTDTVLGLCLLTHQRQRNQAIGIQNDPYFTRQLAQFVRSIEIEAKETSKHVIEATIIKTMIDEHKRLAKKLTDHIMANLDDDDIRNQGVYVMTKLESHITALGERLEELWPQSS